MKVEKSRRASRLMRLLGTATITAIPTVPAAIVSQLLIEQGAQAEAGYKEWVEHRLRAEIAAGLITDGIPSPKGSRPREYRLGMSSDGQIVGEQELFSTMAYFEVWGARAARGTVDASKLSSYLGDAPARWLELLTELRERSGPTLDGARYEQLMHAITGAEVLANAGERRMDPHDWLPVRLLSELVYTDGDGESVYEATLSNPNDVRSPVPGLCIDFRDDAGGRTGHWLVFPSDAAIAPNGEIELRGRINWPNGGKPSSIRFAETSEDFYGADGLSERFPGPAGNSRMID